MHAAYCYKLRSGANLNIDEVMLSQVIGELERMCAHTLWQDGTQVILQAINNGVYALGLPLKINPYPIGKASCSIDVCVNRWDKSLAILNLIFRNVPGTHGTQRIHH